MWHNFSHLKWDFRYPSVTYQKSTLRHPNLHTKHGDRPTLHLVPDLIVFWPSTFWSGSINLDRSIILLLLTLVPPPNLSSNSYVWPLQSSLRFNYPELLNSLHFLSPSSVLLRVKINPSTHPRLHQWPWCLFPHSSPKPLPPTFTRV